MLFESVKLRAMGLGLAAVCGLATSVALAEVPSGLEAGSRVPAFYVTDVTGPLAGEELCYRCRYGAQPVVSIFAKEITPEVVALTKEMDGVVAAHRDEKMAGFVVLMTEDTEKAAATLKTTAKEAKIEQLPLTTFKGATGPSGYDISAKADYTVMMWVDNKVMASKGFNKGELKSETIAALAKEANKLVE